MTSTQEQPRRWRPLVVGAVVTVVSALTFGLAVMWPGYDAQQTPRENAAVWVLQTGEGKRYARVNTDLGEIDTVKDVENPSDIAQFDEAALVFSDGSQRVASIDAATPLHLGDDAVEQFQATPAETVEIIQQDDAIIYLTASGDAHIGSVSHPGATQQIDPYADFAGEDEEDTPKFHSTAAAVSHEGTAVVFSAEESRVLRVNTHSGEIVQDQTLEVETGPQAQMTLAGEQWVLFDDSTGQLWSQSGAQIQTEAEPGALLQRSASDTETVLIADGLGLLQVHLGLGQSERITAGSVNGAPAQPIEVNGTRFAAWLSETQGTAWSSDEGAKEMSFGGLELSDERVPVLQSNGSRALLNEQKSGWVWTLPDAQLVASSQRWNLDEQQPQRVADVESQQVLDPKPPVAEPDSFGVRAGRDAVLPVLLNDHDPNEDVLTIVPDSVQGLDEDFGRVSVSNEYQQLVVSVPETATGSASFQYRVTDGTTADGLHSELATVTLTVISEETNTAPTWCGVDECLTEWPSVEIAPGGTASVDVLSGWVDPEGDPLYLVDAVNQTEVGQVLTSPDGRVTYQHPDPNSTETQQIAIEAQVSDVRGAVTAKMLTVNVTPAALLTLTPIAVTGVPGQPVDVELRTHISGAQGVPILTQATLTDESRGSVTVSNSALSFSFVAAQPGSYPIQVTVSDGTNETTEFIRVTLLDPAQTEISTVPLTAFVRPNEDATVDVLPAVTNPANLVLLLSDLESEPVDESTLSIDAIAQQHMRVAGSTEDGKPGTLGVVNYTVSDGSGAEKRTATGEVTFVLLPATDAVAPIAVDDRVVVRAGAQVDIPVLENDTAPAGAQIAVDPSQVVNEHDAGLAFGTNKLVRYLAPKEPGTYSVSYTIFRLGFPSQTDSARVHITVVSDESNAAPNPTPLEGRVLSGQTVSIPFERFGVDPDGDQVALDRIKTQPKSGSAAISAQGDSIMYTSSPGTKGQDSFTYQVNDERGETGTAEVRVGILDAESDPSPVTYSDYVQIQVGESSEAVIFPAENDIDPSGNDLRVIDVRPNAIAGSPEYEALEKRLLKVNERTGEVRLSAGAELGTSSFVYTVHNTEGDTAMGLIVTKVVREPVPDYPVIRDTKLTAESLEQLAQGVDVLSQQVNWSTGDASTLKLSLWNGPEGFTATGRKISGNPPQNSMIVPFEVAGESFTGTEVTSYGFLRVPGENDVRLSLRSQFAEVQVNEGEQVEIDLAKAVAISKGKKLEVLTEEVSASGARAKAKCAHVSGNTIRYEASTGAPWVDTCTIPVKLTQQSDYTYLTLRVKVIAQDPQPELRHGSVTVSPGDTVKYDLQQLVDWQGAQDRSGLRFAVSYEGAQFKITQEGATLEITALDAAKSGREEPAVVTLTSHSGVKARTLTIGVGPAPSTQPRGATVAQQCSQSGSATSCSIPVIGKPGEVNPLPKTPLKLVSVSGPANCTGVNFEVENATTVRATWSGDAPGANSCTGSFVVEDAQGRQASGDRAGQVMLDLRGLPSTPTRLDLVSFGASEVELRVESAAASYPGVTGYRVTGAGKTTDCPASGTCRIDGLVNGSKHTFEAQALNDVGASRGTASIVAWAYKQPKLGVDSGSFTPVPNGVDGNLVNMTVKGIDSDTASLRVSNGGTDTIVPVTGKTTTFQYLIGTNTPTNVTIRPVTKFELPATNEGASASGEAITVAGVHGIGAPQLNVTLTQSTRQRIVEVYTEVTPNGSNEVVIGYSINNEDCVPQNDSITHTFHNVPRNQKNTIKVCAEHRYNGKTGFGVRTWKDGETVLKIPAPDPGSYTIGPAATKENGSYVWRSVTLNATAPDGYVLMFDRGPGTQRHSDFTKFFESPGVQTGEIFAYSCEQDIPANCSESGALISPTGAPYSPVVTFEPIADSAGFCVAEDLRGYVTLTDPHGLGTVEVVESGNTKQLVVSFNHLDSVSSDSCTLP